MLSPLMFEIAAFLIGLLFGSFLNVCISRLPKHESIISPRSHCTHCAQPIRWYDNFPVVSWIILRARCRDCKAKISWRYPLVELAVGVWFVRYLGDGICWIVQYHYFWDFLKPTLATEVTGVAATLALAILGFLLIGLIVMDWQTHTLPDAFTITGTAIGFFLICIQAMFLPSGVGDIHLNSNSMRMSSPGSMASQGNVFLTGAEALVFGRIGAICGAALLLWLIGASYKAIRNRPGLGFGDVKLLAMIAAFLGFWPAILALFAGLIFCLPYALWLLLTGRARRETPLPFGSFLAAGGLFAALVGEPLLRWYSSLL